jgi:hypothetical protein
MSEIERIDNELYKAIFIFRDVCMYDDIWKLIRRIPSFQKEAVQIKRDKFDERDTVTGIAIADTMLKNYKYADKEAYNKLIKSIYSNKDIVNVIEKFKIKIGFDDDYAKTLQKRIEKIVYNENYAKYFNPKYLVKTECDILYHHGKTSDNSTIERPDRVIFSDDETWVVDFKTGVPMINYQEQINRYIEIISDMGYPNVSGEVIYC